MLGHYFKMNTRWSVSQRIPPFGDDSTKTEDVDRSSNLNSTSWNQIIKLNSGTGFCVQEFRSFASRNLDFSVWGGAAHPPLRG